MSDWNPLPHLSAITLTGPDAGAFAHSQLTTGFDQPAEPGWGLTAWCNPKGRAIAVILARQHQQGVDLVVPAGQGQQLTRQLGMYAIGRKVEFQRTTQVQGCMDREDDGDQTLRPDPGRALRLIENDPAAADPGFIEHWRQRDLAAGITWLDTGSSGRFLPQALGLEERGGLSYRKGCFPGQEVIARVHYLGKAKEQLSGFRLKGSVECSEQDLLDAHDQRVGSVVNAMPINGTTIGLAVVRADRESGLAVRCLDHDGVLCAPEQLMTTNS